MSNNEPRSPYKYFVCIDRALTVHHLRIVKALPEPYCEAMEWPFVREIDGLIMWITQEQLDAMPSKRWCQACLDTFS